MPSPAPILLLFVATWVAISAVLSYAGGWRALSNVYPDLGSAEGETFRFASMSLGRGLFPVNYGSCLSVRVGALGIGVSMALPLWPFHPPLFIPWAAVSACEVEQFLLVQRTSVWLASPDNRLRFSGRAGRAIKQQYDRLGFGRTRA